MPTLKRKREADTPFNIDQKAHFKGCGEDEVMLTTQEHLQLEQTLKKFGIALEVVDVPGNSSRKRRKTPVKDHIENKEQKSPIKGLPAKKTAAEDILAERLRKTVTALPAKTSAPKDILAERLRKRRKAATAFTDQEKEEREIQLAMDKLTWQEYERLIAIWRPEFDHETGHYMFGFANFSPLRKNGFRIVLQNLLANTAVKRTSYVSVEPMCGELGAAGKRENMPPPRRTTKKQAEKDREVEEMIREFDSWI